MRIAQVSPLFESVPPKMYGGTERVVSFLTEELVAMGHDVTLFASGDSRTGARLIPACERALRLDQVRDVTAPHVLQLEQVMRRASDFDLIHFHTDCLHFPLTRRVGPVNVTTMHGRLDLSELAGVYQEFLEMPLVSISNSQRRPLDFANWVGTVYHGLPPELFAFNPHPVGYLAFVGRVSPEKGLDRAIRIAQAAGIELRIGAKVDSADRDYFDHVLRPMLSLSGIRYLGEVNDQQKQELMGGAIAVLFPIDWPEPFGLVMIEAMACGTPVIAAECGSVPEVVDHGRTGFVVRSEAEAVEAARAAHTLDRRMVRSTFEQRFSARRMAEDYVRIYEERVYQAGGRMARALHGRSRLD